MDLHARIAMGIKIVITERFIITWVRRKGTMKNTSPIRYLFPSIPMAPASTPPTASPAPVAVSAPPMVREPINRKPIHHGTASTASCSERTPVTTMSTAPVRLITQISRPRAF